MLNTRAVERASPRVATTIFISKANWFEVGQILTIPIVWAVFVINDQLLTGEFENTDLRRSAGTYLESLGNNYRT